MASHPQSSSTLYRYLFMAALGLLVGIVATVMLMRALQARRDPFPSSLMQVMAHQSQQLAASHRQNRCTANDALQRLQSLRALSNDLEAAFPELADDHRYAAHASLLRARLDQALAAPADSCAALHATRTRIEEACKACHQDFR